MELKRETICEDTLKFVQEYYRLNTEPLFSILADDCVWMGTGNVLASGAAAIRGFFKDGFIMPPYHLAEPDFRLVKTGCEGQLIVLGQYALYSDGDAQLINAVKQRSTFCFREEKGQWRLYHMHISNEWNELVKEEIFPIQISTQTYHYVKKLLAESVSKKPPVLVIKTDLCNQFVDTNTVIYIQLKPVAASTGTIWTNQTDKKSPLTGDNSTAGTADAESTGNAAEMADVSYSQKLTADVASLLTGSSGGIFP